MAPQQEITVRIARVDAHAIDIPLPAYATDGSAGVDLRASVEEGGEFIILGGKTALVPTGIKLEIPRGYEGQVRPRSGLAITHQIGVLNSPGTIDSDYRGEVKVILTNFGTEPFLIKRGDRIAQLVFAPVARATWVEVPDVDATGRGAGGFGHTGR